MPRIISTTLAGSLTLDEVLVGSALAKPGGATSAHAIIAPNNSFIMIFPASRLPGRFPQLWDSNYGDTILNWVMGSRANTGRGA